MSSAVRNESAARAAAALGLDSYTRFKSILIAILFGAALIVATIGNLKDAAVILAVVVINAFVGFLQEYCAERSLPESAN